MAKVAIIGAGYVGSTLAYAMLIKGVASEIALVDINEEKAHGEALDLEHGLIHAPKTRFSYGDDYALCQGADVVLITAGVAQKPGETRLDLVKRNAAIFAGMVPRIAANAPDAVLVVVTNPVDIVTELTLRYSGFPPERVFGTGTSLDTARLRQALGARLGIDPHNVHAFVLGEHGDSEFVVWSRATIAGLTPAEQGLAPAELEEIGAGVRKAAYEIISRKGATYYAIGLVAADIAEALIRDEQLLLPVSTRLENYYDEGGLCLSVPCVLGRGGIVRRVQLPLDDAEQAALHRSAGVLREVLAGLDG